MTDKIQINLRVKEEMLKRIKEQAKKENRSINNFIENVIQIYLNAYETK